MSVMKFVSQLTCVAALTTVGFVSVANAEDDTFSTEAYCLLQKENIDARYLAAYADKLGLVPSRKTCRSFLDFAESVTPKEWDYPQGRPYPGSVIRLTPDQLKRIRSSKEK